MSPGLADNVVGLTTTGSVKSASSAATSDQCSAIANRTAEMPLSRSRVRMASLSLSRPTDRGELTAFPSSSATS
jgi:hypothetical protein